MRVYKAIWLKVRELDQLLPPHFVAMSEKRNYISASRNPFRCYVLEKKKKNYVSACRNHVLSIGVSIYRKSQASPMLNLNPTHSVLWRSKEKYVLSRFLFAQVSASAETVRRCSGAVGMLRTPASMRASQPRTRTTRAWWSAPRTPCCLAIGTS